MTESILRDAIKQTDLFDAVWMYKHGWCAVPIGEPFVPESTLVDQVIDYNRKMGLVSLVGLEVEMETFQMQLLDSDRSSLNGFLTRIPRFGDAIIGQDLTFMILCPLREFCILAAKPPILEAMLGSTLNNAFKKFSIFADNPANSFYDDPSHPRYYQSIFKHYKLSYVTGVLDSQRE